MTTAINKTSWLLKTVVLTAIVCTLLFATVNFASASEAENAEQDASVAATHIEARADADVVSPFTNLQYKLVHWEGAWIVTIRGIISEDLVLPATVEIGVPTGSNVDWIGEVYAGFGSQPLGSGEIAPPYNRVTEGDLDIYTIVLNQTHAIQVEYVFPDNPLVESSEDGAIALSYTPLNDADELWLATAIPAGAVVPDPQFRELEGLGPNGEISFARVIYNAVGGETYDTVIEYRTGVTEVERNLAPWVLPVLVGSLAAVAAAVFFFFVRGAKTEPEQKESK